MRWDNSVVLAASAGLLAIVGCADGAGYEALDSAELGLCSEVAGGIETFPAVSAIAPEEIEAPPGTPVNVAACLECAVGGAVEPTEYRFLSRPLGGSFQVFRGWALASEATMPGAAAGTYEIRVETRPKGSTVTGYTFQTVRYDLGTKCADLAVAPSPLGPQPPGTQVTLKARGECGTLTPEYRFEYQGADGRWNLIQNFGAASTATWTLPSTARDYAVRVAARKPGSTTSSATRLITYTVGGAAYANTLTGCAPPTLRATGVPYATTSPRNVMDLYLSSSSNCPLVLWIHGGQWDSGSRALGPATSGTSQKLKFLMDQGYNIASIDYRLSADAAFPAQIHDAKAAVRWVKANLNPSYVVAMGSSAGGQLASLLATSGGVTRLEDLNQGNSTVSSSVNGLISCHGPVDFPAMDEQLAASCPASAQTHDLACSPENRLVDCHAGYDAANPMCVARTADANPATHLSQFDPPALFGHGAEDCAVPPAQTVNLANAYAAAAPGQFVEYEIRSGGKHTVGGPEDGCPRDEDVIKPFLEHLEMLFEHEQG